MLEDGPRSPALGTPDELHAARHHVLGIAVGEAEKRLPVTLTPARPAPSGRNAGVDEKSG